MKTLLLHKMFLKSAKGLIPLKAGLQIIAALVLFAWGGNPVFAQYNKLNNPVPAEYPKEIVGKYIDPSYPKYTNTGNKFEDYNKYEQGLREWSAKQEPFPKYKSTGNAQSDAENYERAKNEWFKKYPHFPLLGYIDPKNKEQQEEEYKHIVREWFNHFPKKHQEVLDFSNPEQNSDDETINIERRHNVNATKTITDSLISQENNESAENTEPIIAIPPDQISDKFPTFPKYIDTGNKEEDSTRYNESVMKWFEENKNVLKKEGQKYVEERQKLIEIERKKRDGLFKELK